MVAPFVSTPSIADEPTTVTVTGTILAPQDGNDTATPLVGAAIARPGTTKGTASTTDGTFTLSNIPSDAKLQISYVGYKTKEINLSDHTPTNNRINLGNITLAIESQESEDVVITGNSVGYQKCNTDSIATGLRHGTKQCFPCKCSNGYTLMTKNKRNPTLTYQHVTDESAQRSTKTGQDICPNSALFTGIDNATEYVQNMEDVYNDLSGMQCVATTNCARGAGVRSSKYELQDDDTYKCIATCYDGYTQNPNDTSKCQSADDCTPDNNNNVRYAKWRKRNGKYVCIITECVRGYEPNDAGTECVAKVVLPEEQSAERIDELQGVYNEAKANETSYANKMLGGASMGATGAGGMMLSMGLAEQKADNAAYEQMRGYVSTFKCNYGANNVEYSVEPTQLPTSTELTNLYAEYVTLANDLKMRKSALGLRAGLESQPILDSATSGLYDDVSSGRATGTFTSLARAILDPNGEDAKRWAEQTQKSKNLIIAGGVTAGVGVVGGIVGNTLINKDAPNLQSVRKKIDDINKKYAEFYKEFERVADDLGGTLRVEEIEEDSEKPEDPTGNNDDSSQGDEEPVETEEPDNQLNGFCKSCPSLISTGTYPKCFCRDINKTFNKMTCQCEDMSIKPTEVPRIQPLVPTTIIPGDSLTGVDIKSHEPLSTPTDITLSIPGSTLFDTGKYIIKEQAKNSLRQLIDALNTLNTTLKQASYNVTVTGHTDTEGGKNSNGNKDLSQRRANAVKDLLGAAAQQAGLTLNITPSGKAGTECTCASGLTEDSTETEFSVRASMTCQQTKSPYAKPKCCADATDYATAKDIEIPDNTKFEPCRRVDITFELPPIDASLLASYGITGTGNKTLTLTEIQQLAAKATAGAE